jgi:uncharacterized repeat protein (TIGR02543 family)
MCNGSDDSATTDDVSCRQEKYQLSVISSGGTVTSTPSGISCGSICSYKFAPGSVVTLTASPKNDNYSFSGWTGCNNVKGDGTCEVTMDSNKSVTANFSQITYTLTVKVSDGGSVSGNGINNCTASTCTATVNSGTQVSLSASPNNGYSFSGWTDACDGTGECSFAMNGDKTVNALFSPVGVLSGSITSPHCTVAVGESSCDTTITWSVVNYAEGSTTEVTTPENKVIGNTHSGSTTYEITLSEGNRNFFFFFI